MARVDVSADSAMDPRSLWECASDLHRFGEWMTIFGGWRSAVPLTIQQGTRVSSLIKVKGFRNIIHWRVTRYDKPHKLELAGSGRGGVHIGLTMSTTPRDQGSTLHLAADLSGGLLNGPVGRLVAKVVASDTRRSVHNLAELAA